MKFLPLGVVFSLPVNIQFIYFSLSLVIGVAGKDKTMGFWGYFLSSVIFSPLIGLMLVLASGKKNKN